MMAMRAALLVILGCLAMQAFSANPTFPDKYYLEAVLTLPYASLREPIRMAYDGTNNRCVYTLYEDLTNYLLRYDTGVSYEVFVRKDHRECRHSASAQGAQAVSLLPTLDSWTEMPQTVIHNIPVRHFQLVQKDGGKTNTYDFYLFDDGAGQQLPVQYHMMGYDVVFGSHYDEYVLDYGLYLPNFDDATAFDVPELCSSEATSHEVPLVRGELRLRALFPSAPAPEDEMDEFDSFIAAFGRTYARGTVEYERRRSSFERNVQTIRRHNAENSNSGYTMEINRFADLEPEEFRALMLPSSGKYGPNSATLTHRISGATPSAVDWRQKGAVTAVKDQGVCGSCWSFGTTGTLEGSFMLKTGRLVEFSEQQLVDCAWTDSISDFDNNGCEGGLPSLAMEYLMRVGGIEEEISYPYRMVDDFCKFHSDRVRASISGYVNVTFGDEKALENAVAEKGPISVAINVQESLVFYSSGVYYEPKCKSAFEDLDHAVLVVGYGSQDGSDYWIVKNSWSTHWGDGGYVKMARNRDNNCGIASSALYAIIA